jgi:hypothetical protein
MEPNDDIEDDEMFSEREKRGLLGKIINLLNNHHFTNYGPNSDYERYKIKNSTRSPSTFGRNYMMRVFKEYGFTNQELRFLFNKIVECNPKTYYQNKDKVREIYNSITKSDTLTNGELITIFLYLEHWQLASRYNPINTMDNFLCGYLGQMRQQRQERKNRAIKDAVDDIYGKLPTDILKNTANFLDVQDRKPFIDETKRKVSQATGGKKRKTKRKIKNRNRKRKTNRRW